MLKYSQYKVHKKIRLEIVEIKTCNTTTKVHEQRDWIQKGKKTSKKYKKRNKEDIMQIDIEDEKIMNVMSDQH